MIIRNTRVVEISKEQFNCRMAEQDRLEILDLMIRYDCKFSDIISVIRIRKVYVINTRNPIIDIEINKKD